MARTVSIGQQDFETIRNEGYFYVDKTAFIREWWDGGDSVTLVTRPRRFGKTLNMSMVEKFFSVKYAGRKDLFEGLSVWEDEKYRKLQGTCPVISLSFAGIKETAFAETRTGICRVIEEQYNMHDYLLEGNLLNDKEKAFYREISADMPNNMAAAALRSLAGFLSRYYGKKVIILLDEYDTPMQEAYVHGYWDELAAFTRSMFNATFKTNPYLDRALMTGITRVSRESMFSDLNNLKVVTTTSEEYADCFGFTEKEVFTAMDEFGLSDQKAEVKRWYDGFIFGSKADIYNPWSIINYLDTGKLATYWANTSSNSLAGKLVREGGQSVKQSFERLLQGEHLFTPIDEQIVYNELGDNAMGIWSLLVASGYLKVVSYEELGGDGMDDPLYEVALTNREVRRMFRAMVRGWFRKDEEAYNAFIQSLLCGDVEGMNEYMNDISRSVFSYFDTGNRPGKDRPERFYHGFVLGLMVELRGRYILTSNRESGLGRYDVMLEPKKPEDDAILIEFKVFKPAREKDLSDTVAAALEQIEAKGYEAALTAKGIGGERIRKYGFAFRGKQVLIGGGEDAVRRENV